MMKLWMVLKIRTLYYIQSLYRWRKALDFGNKAASC